MKKSDLRSGMLVMNEENKISLVLLNTEKGDHLTGWTGMGDTSSQTWASLGYYNENLENENHKIIKVYGYDSNYNGASNALKDRPLLWERQPNKVITLTKDYDAEIDLKNSIVKVGCQNIPFTVVEELYKLIK